MVDARLPAEWLGSIRIDDLSDRAFRVLAGALMWCNGQGTDGSVPARYVRYLHPDGADPEAFDELEQAGLWRKTPDGYLLDGWSTDLRQSTSSEVQRYRESSRLRQKAYRDRKRSSANGASAPLPSGAPETHAVTRDVATNVGSGSLEQAKKVQSHALRNVTRNADSPYCSRHPAGTLDPCGACARARVAHAARQSTIPGLGWDCHLDGHKLVARRYVCRVRVPAHACVVSVLDSSESSLTTHHC